MLLRSGGATPAVANPLVCIQIALVVAIVLSAWLCLGVLEASQSSRVSIAIARVVYVCNGFALIGMVYILQRLVLQGDAWRVSGAVLMLVVACGVMLLLVTSTERAADNAAAVSAYAAERERSLQPQTSTHGNP